jgi:REase_DpnII-MboI
MEKSQAIEKLKQQLKQISLLKNKEDNSQEFKEWRRDTKVAITKIFAGDNGGHLNEFTKINYSPMALSMMEDNTWRYQKSYLKGLETSEAMLKSMIKEIDEWGLQDTRIDQPNALQNVIKLCGRFHLVVRQLRDRHNGRPTLSVEDEYDVQDSLHALLLVDFDDIRPEEWTPSYAGSSSRMDFLLKNEQIVIETKKTRNGLGAKEIGEQLIIDIEKYRGHPDCKTLVCFVYDPEGRIGNPKGIENDLNRIEGDLTVKVIIAPTGL